MGIRSIVSSTLPSMLIAAQLGLPLAAYADFADEGWGDLGYTKSEAQVESIPTSVEAEGADAYHAVEPSPEAVAANQDIVMDYGESNATVSGEDVKKAQVTQPDNEAAARAETIERARGAKAASASTSGKNGSSSGTGRSFGRISTVRNSHGVLTEENPDVQFYISPFGGMTSVLGNTTVDASARYALGAQAGLLLTSNLLVNLSYTYSEQNLSGLRSSATNGFVNPTPDVFALKSNHIEAGAKLFFLGRESRVRPFFGGGLGWGKNYLNYTAANLQALASAPVYLTDFAINQFDAYGELGAEVAITRAVVVNASFRLRGILSRSTSVNSAEDAAQFDATKALVGDSLSRSASYTIGAGLGVYF